MELSTGAFLKTFATSSAGGILSLGAVLLNTSSKTVSVLAIRRPPAGLEKQVIITIATIQILCQKAGSETGVQRLIGIRDLEWSILSFALW